MKASMANDLDDRESTDRVNLREQAYHAFTSRLLTRAIEPGQFISQRKLVTLTGMPLGAIRELIPRLEAEGLIRTVPQRGLQIAQVDLSLVRDAFQFRLFLEREAIALFAGSVADDELARWRRDHEAILALKGTKPTRAQIDSAQAVDWNFHDRIIDALGNSIVSNAYRVNSIKIRLIRREKTRLDDGLLEPAMRDHLKVIAALEKRDVAGAQAALGEHIENARRRALDL
jgi:DNA-binding GntR family transcriptional regulator